MLLRPRAEDLLANEKLTSRAERDGPEESAMPGPCCSSHGRSRSMEFFSD